MIATAEHSWASGEYACEHGMDLRLFIAPGFEKKELEAAVGRSRFTALARQACGAHAPGLCVLLAPTRAAVRCAGALRRLRKHWPRLQ